MKTIAGALEDLAYIKRYRHPADDRNRDFGEAACRQWESMILSDEKETGELGETSRIMVERTMRAFNRKARIKTIEV